MTDHPEHVRLFRGPLSGEWFAAIVAPDGTTITDKWRFSDEDQTTLNDLASQASPEPLVEPVSGNSLVPKCLDCGRERTLSDFNDYNPLQVVMGQPLGWYSGSDGEICGDCMAKMMGRANS